MVEPQINYFEVTRLLKPMNLDQFITVDTDGWYRFTFKPDTYMYPQQFDTTCRRMVFMLRKLGLMFIKSTFERKNKRGNRYMSGELTWILDDEDV